MRSRPTSRWIGLFLCALLLVAFAVRFGVTLGLRDIHQADSRISDAREFNAIALNLASGRGYAVVPGHPTSFRAPGFPLFLAAIYRISYENYVLVYLALSMVGAVTCLLTYGVARQLLSEGQARLAGCLAAVYLPHVYSSAVWMSEVLFALCIALGLWLLLRALRNSSVWLLAAAGACMGYAALTRPIALLFPVFLAPALFRAAGPNWGRLIRTTVPFGLAALAVVLPWSLRNYTVYHRLVLIATNGGSTFYGANNDITLHNRAYLGSWIATSYLPGRNLIEAAPDEVSHDQVEWTLGKQWVSTHVASLPILEVYKLARFWLPDTQSGNRKFVLMQFVAYVPMGLLMGLGLAVLLRPLRWAASPEWLAVHAILAANLASTLVFYGSARFRDSITPVLMIYATVGLTELAGWLGFRIGQSDSRPAKSDLAQTFSGKPKPGC